MLRIEALSWQACPFLNTAETADAIRGGADGTRQPRIAPKTSLFGIASRASQSYSGRGAGVGRGLGVGEHLPVHGVGVAVAVGVEVGLNVAVAVGVGVGFGTAAQYLPPVLK